MKKRRKNLIKVAMILALVILLVIIIVAVSNKKEEKPNTRDEELAKIEEIMNSVTGESFEVGYIDVPANEKEVLLNDYNEFKKYFDKYSDTKSLMGMGSTRIILDKYNEEYFKEKKIAVVYEPVNSDDIVVRYKKCKVKDELATITCKIKTPTGEMSTEKNGYFVVVELPNDVRTIKVERENAPR